MNRHDKWVAASEVARDVWNGDFATHENRYNASLKAFIEALEDATREELATMVFVFTVGERPPSDREEVGRN